MNDPFISVIITVKNAEKTIGNCIDSVLSLDFSNYETIVVDDCSNDNTPRILKTFSNKITIIHNSSTLGPSASRNLAVKQAAGKYIAFTDADCLVKKDWLKNLLSGFIGNDIAAVGGRQDLPSGEPVFGVRVFKFMLKTGLVSDYVRATKGGKIIEVNHNPSCNVMYSREVFMKAGGFLENLWPGEDVELDHRLKKSGYRIVFNPAALVYHHKPENLKKFRRMMFRYGSAQGSLVKKYGIFRKIHFVPFFSLLFLVLLLGIAFRSYVTCAVIALIVFLASSFYLQLNPYLLLLSIVSFIYWNIGFYRALLFSKKI